MIRRYKIKIINRGGRLRAALTSADEKHHYGEWWIESAGHVRYNPLKPVHPKAMAIINMLPDNKIKEVAMFLLMAGEGDEYVFEV